jgi:phage protein D
MPLDSNGLKAARPKILIDGQENFSLIGGLKYLLIVEKTNGLYRCEAKFSNWGSKNNSTDFLYFDRRTLDFGKDFQVNLADDVIFSGRITALEANFPEGQAPEITVLAEDALQNLRMTRRTRTFEDMSDEDIFKKIAGEHRLTPNINVSGATHKVSAQVNQSDLAFMRERARSIDAEIWLKDKELNVKTRANRRGEKISLKYKSEMREFRVTADLANQRTSVVAAGWDVSGKEAVKHEADDSVIGSELGSDASGISILKSAFGERKESLVHGVPLSSQEARSAAESYLKTIARQFVVGRGVAEPNAKLRVGASVELDGLGKLFNGKYYVSEIAHIFDSEKGFRTEFRAERTGIGK